MAYNSTIITKQKVCRSCGKKTFIFSKGMCVDCSKLASFSKRQAKQNEEDGTGELIEKLDVLFSKFIRLKAADENGICECFTCGVGKHWTLMQCGHFITRNCLYLRHDTRNARVQCDSCNCGKHGNLEVFAVKLEEEKPGIVEILREERSIIQKYTKEELYSLLNQYKSSIKYSQLK